MLNERLVINNKLRIKVTDRCDMNCWFCHSEGSHGCDDIQVNSELCNTLKSLRDTFSQVHLTGGEPLLFKDLGLLIDVLRQHDYKVSITSNGLFSINEQVIRWLDKCEYINISFHSLNPVYYSLLSQTTNGDRIISKIKTNIITLMGYVPLRINTVVSGNSEIQHLGDMLDFASQIGCEIKCVPELKTKVESIKIIYDLLDYKGYYMYEITHITPGSNYRKRYKNSNNNIVEVKLLEPCFPDCICGNCENVRNCEEGFSFLRLCGNPLECQSCIKHPPIKIDVFINEIWPNLRKEFIKRY